MQNLKRVNNRQVIYHDFHKNLDEFNAADLRNWLAFVIADEYKYPLLHSFAEMCINKSILYMCATGIVGSKIDDLFDFVTIERSINQGQMPAWYLKEDDVLMTTWHDNFEEGFWFATTLARYESFPIDTVLVANFTDFDYRSKIDELCSKINNGWLPTD